MGIVETLAVAVGLALDASAVSLAASASRRTRGPRGAVRLAFHFGLFQFLMPLAGWLAGSAVVVLIDDIGHWVAFGLLCGIGVHMIWSSRRPHDPQAASDPSRRWSLVLLCIATSIDALAVGVSLAFLQADILVTAAVIGVVTFVLSLLGFILGTRLGDRLGGRMEIAGGVVLILVGLKVLLA